MALCPDPCTGLPWMGLDQEEAQEMAQTTARLAECAYCKTTVPSQPSLPFFENRAAGTQDDVCRVCHYYRIAHERFDGVRRDTVAWGRWPLGLEPHPFEPMTDGYPHDLYYCGCHGWD